MLKKIWSDRIALLKVWDTGYLKSSLGSATPIFDQASMQFTFEFVQYGIYAEAGVGNGYLKGEANGGDLEILDPAYRYWHGLDKPRKAGKNGKMTSGHPRKRKIWYSRSWYISQKVLSDKLLTFMGDSFEHLFDDFTIEKKK